MKKTYQTPICEAHILTTGKLFTTPASLPVGGGKADDGGWSKKFWGLTEEDEEEKDFDWE
ncbi:MAG: hypothetical protein IKN22_05005 [Bacteroidaceae bacterium]|nr:hypothetical protein [Bacteroidaceae bacterium]MBR3372561.1 hypothetical protein [Bacteroidaceae bacterium]MBR3633388.1 hypothetical protein [Bacteroidaceae bacterium]MBR3733869.1 hypothetical protein [Bacteroidaceae bacterium]